MNTCVEHENRNKNNISLPAEPLWWPTILFHINYRNGFGQSWRFPSHYCDERNMRIETVKNERVALIHFVWNVMGEYLDLRTHAHRKHIED